MGSGGISVGGASARLTGRAQLDTNLFVSESQTDAWFYTSNGERLGPVAKDQLVELAASGVLNPRLDLCWTHGMEEWLPAGEIDGLYEKKRPSQNQESVSPDKNLPRHPQQLSKLSEGELELELLHAKWPGASRRVYLFAIWVLPVLVGVAFGALSYFFFDPEDPADLEILTMGYGVVSLVLVLVMIYVSLLRFQNLGMSRWWFLGNFVPLLNLWVGHRSICCPAGYDFHRKLDGAGIFLAIVYWGLIVLFLATVVLATLALLGLAGGGLFEGFDQVLESWIEEVSRFEEGEAPQEE